MTQQIDTDIIQAVVADDDETLANILLENNINKYYCFQEKNKKLPIILNAKPPLQCVVCFFRAIRCFDVLKNLGWNFDTCVDLEFRKAIHFACAGGSIEIVRALAEKKSIFEKTDKYRNTPIHYAAEYGSVSIFHYLFSKGIESIYINSYNWYPIHYAIQNGFAELIDFMLNSTEFRRLKNDEIRQFSELAIQNNHFNILMIFQKHYPKSRGCIQGAIGARNIEILDYLLRNQKNIINITRSFTGMYWSGIICKRNIK